jgi:23S rRNA (cytidine1920-2'-O)/16S rRNA (cytidine1409-2'-O)-methyltransferase
MLVKPQFEAGRREAARGEGVISDPEVWGRVVNDVITALSARRAVIMGCMVSPLLGAEGNVEFLLVARASTDGEDGGLSVEVDLDALLVEARELQIH